MGSNKECDFGPKNYADDGEKDQGKWIATWSGIKASLTSREKVA